MAQHGFVAQTGRSASVHPPATGTSIGCVTGPTEVVATQAMDLRALDRDEKAACAQAHQWIDFVNRENSLLITNPQGKGNTQHPLKGVPSNHPVVEGIRKWVAAEQP